METIGKPYTLSLKTLNPEADALDFVREGV